jgi:7,8-dihydropterin-6-yl-methyl-4-(beta-D-ribofuranosyl)aminobenzene 5'-phosphate synthase
MKFTAFPAGLLLLATMFIRGPASAETARDRITILYDAFGKPSVLQKDWGYAALIEYGGKRILFDTGNNAETFQHNVEALKLSLKDLDFVVLSHRHGDHTSGLNYVLSVNPQVRIYTPYEISQFGTPVMPGIVSATKRHFATLPNHMHYFDGKSPQLGPSGSPWPNAQFVQIEKTTEVAPGFFLISTISDTTGTKEMHEISFAFRTPEGLVLVVGCSHPGILNIVKDTASVDARIYSVFGGFHLLSTSDEEIQRIARELHDTWKIRTIGPGHCGGLGAFAALRDLYQDKYLYAGLGTSIPLP